MSLTDEAKELARYLAQAWDKGVIESNFILIDVTAGSSTNTIELTAGLGVKKPDEFKTPKYSALMELAHFSDLISVLGEARSWEHSGRLTVQLSQNLREAVKAGFVSKPTREAVLGHLPNIFISYKREETRIVELLAKYLRRVYGNDQVWFDKDILASELWWNKIMAEIGRRDILIYVHSREALESVYCRAELAEAWRLGKRIIPIQLRKAIIPSDLAQFQYVPLPNDEFDVNSIVELFAAIVRQTSDVPQVVSEGLWGTRSIRPVDHNSLEITFKVPANRDPGKERDYCNTGLLLVSGDELHITASGSISFNNGNTWCDPYGGCQTSANPHQPGLFIEHAGAYPATGHPKNSHNPDIGVIGSLIGWIGSDELDLESAFVVGSEWEKQVGKGQRGFLHLAVNDARGTYGDNLEAFDVNIKISHSTE